MTSPGFTICYVALWLVLFVPDVAGVCGSCFGAESSCTDSGYAKCPWQVVAVANTVALAATGAAVVSMTLLLPVRLLRIFTPGAISALMGLYRRPREGKDFDLPRATPKGIVTAVNSKYCDKSEAMMELSDRLFSMDPSASDYESKKVGIKVALDVLKCMENAAFSPSQEAGSEGALSYIMARLSGITNKGTTASFDLNVVEAERETEKGAGASSSTSSRFSANLIRAKTFAQVCSLLNHFILVSCSAGVTSLQLVSPFLDEVFYEPVRTGDITWPVGFEMILIYLQLVETQPSHYNLSNVVRLVGGIDAFRKKALRVAEGLYPKGQVELFRAPRVEPRDNVKDDKNGDKKFTGSLAGFNQNSTKGCVAHNLGGHHLAKYVDKNKCRFFHGCDQYVTDKGPAGQCLATDHVRADCTYDASKKCSQPLK